MKGNEISQKLTGQALLLESSRYITHDAFCNAVMSNLKTDGLWPARVSGPFQIAKAKTVFQKLAGQFESRISHYSQIITTIFY